MDEDTYDAWYAASFGRIVVQVSAMVGNRDEAMDCVQEASSAPGTTARA